MFTLNLVADNEPMINDNFHKWLDQYDLDTVPRRALLDYLKSLGFITGQDQLTEKQLTTLKYILDNWYRVTPLIREPLKFSNHFKSEKHGFYVQNKPGKWAISDKIKNTLSHHWIYYAVCPDTTYFELMADGRLYAKYQTILGQLFIGRVTT